MRITMVATPGSPHRSIEKATGVLPADEGELTEVDPINYETEPVPDARGRITLPALIPGATYRITDYTMFRPGRTGPEIRKEFTVTPGQKLELGDIRIANPSR
jgi:hypothetical protein